MENLYQIIDQENWERAMHCQILRNCVEPAFCITFELNITVFLEYVRSKKYSFTMALVYSVTKCANRIEAFRYRFLDGQVVLFDKIDTAFTYLNQDTELFKVVNVPMAETMAEYVVNATKAAKEQKAYFTGPLEMIYFSFLPYLGLHIPIFLIPIWEKRIMPLLCLTGVSMWNGMVKSFCHFLYRHIIPL